jgi:Ser/Thr protein kinase RdoA (MazF antagonist)
MIAQPALQRLIARAWGLRAPLAEPLSGGMNSATWLVHDGTARWVAKAVPTARADAFAAGLTVAAHVDAAGIPSGAPRLADDGRLVVVVGDAAVALLAYVDGYELTGDDEDERRRMGAVLGRAHRAIADLAIGEAAPFPGIDPSAPALGVRDGVRERVVDTLATWHQLDPSTLSWGPVHSDPAPEAFRYDAAHDRCGLIDWDQGLVAPHMYDVASAVMYLGGPDWGEPFLAGYLATGPLDEPEVRRSLRPMLRLRWAVQAAYFAQRLATDDRTGISDPAENEVGLDDAVRGLDHYRDG